MMRASLTGLLALTVVVACAQSPSGPPEPLTKLPRALTVAEGEVVQRSNRFAFALLRRSAAARDSNVFVSPLSVSMALGMTMNGAANATLDSMRATLGFEGMPLAEINAGYRGLIDLLRGLDATTDMRVANSVWFRQGLTADPDFSAALLASFDAKVQALDFGLPSAPSTMNQWVSDATNSRIKEIVGEIPADIVMYLINAIYFKAKWLQQFDVRDTRPGEFAAGFGGAQTVPTMHRRIDLRVRLGPDVRIAELRYGNAAFVMDLVMPGPGGDVNALVDSLTPERWASWLAAMNPMSLDVSLPRFKLEYYRMLNADLAALGMGIAFLDGVADFRNIFEPNQTGPFISFVGHKTFLEVNEEGTEAAAVTSVGMGVTSMPPSFDVDEPFLLVIRERFSGTILFMGKILRIPQ